MNNLPFWSVTFTGDTIQVSALIISAEQLKKFLRVLEVLTPLFEPRQPAPAMQEEGK